MIFELKNTARKMLAVPDYFVVADYSNCIEMSRSWYVYFTYF